MTISGTSHGKNESIVAMMSSDLNDQRSLLEKLLHLAESQGRLIESAEHDSLLALVHERQLIVEELIAIRSSLAERAESLRNHDVPPSDQERESLQRQIDETRELSEKVLAIDNQDVGRLMDNRNDCQEKLSGMAHAMNARRGYRQRDQASPRFADAKG